MGARVTKLKMTDGWKEKIKISHILDRLAKHVDGEIEMSSTQIKAADILLKKVTPDLSSVAGAMTHTHNYFDNLANDKSE